MLNNKAYNSISHAYNANVRFHFTNACDKELIRITVGNFVCIFIGPVPFTSSRRILVTLRLLTPLRQDLNCYLSCTHTQAICFSLALTRPNEPNLVCSMPNARTTGMCLNTRQWRKLPAAVFLVTKIMPFLATLSSCRE
jgi:hypothetical protein